MKTHHRFTLLAWSALGAVLCSAQPAPKDADAEWLEVLKAAKPAPTSNAKKTRADVQKESAAKSAAARAAEKLAKDFYTAHPAHINAAEARRMEAVFGLLGILDGDSAQEQAAQSRAKAFRNNSANSQTDRFEVALLSERTESRAKLKGRLDMQNISELEKIADKLKTEFGNMPDVYRVYASIARTADMANAKRIASTLLASAADQAVKDEAATIIARDALVGKPLNLKLTSIEGQTVDLSQPSAGIRVLYVCMYGSGSTHALSGLAAFKSTLPANADVVYLALGATREQAQNMKSLAPVPGRFCVDDGDQAAAQHLYIQRAPYAFVMSPAGAVSGFGPAAEIGKLVAAAAR